MKVRSGGDTGSADIAGVGGDFRLMQDDMHAGAPFLVYHSVLLYKQSNCIFLTTVVSYHKRCLWFNMGNAFSAPILLLNLRAKEQYIRNYRYIVIDDKVMI